MYIIASIILINNRMGAKIVRERCFSRRAAWLYACILGQDQAIVVQSNQSSESPGEIYGFRHRGYDARPHCPRPGRVTY
jgi:hypothetical protein